MFCEVVEKSGLILKFALLDLEFYLTNGTKIERGLRLVVITFKLLTGESINFMRKNDHFFFLTEMA